MKMGLIDAKVMDESQLIWLSGCHFRAKNTMIYQFSIQEFKNSIFLLFHPHENQVQMMKWHLYNKGPFTNYVDKFLAFFDHLPTSVDIFYLMNIDKKSKIWTTYPLLLVNVVCECPLSLRIFAIHNGAKLWGNPRGNCRYIESQ